MADGVEPFAFVFEILGACDGTFYTGQMLCQRCERPCFAIITDVFIVDNLTEGAGVFVAVAVEFDLLTNRDTGRQRMWTAPCAPDAAR